MVVKEVAGVSLSESEREREWVCSAEGKLLEGEGGDLQNTRVFLVSLTKRRENKVKCVSLVISHPPSCSTSG